MFQQNRPEEDTVTKGGEQTFVAGAKVVKNFPKRSFIASPGAPCLPMSSERTKPPSIATCSMTALRNTNHLQNITISFAKLVLCPALDDAINMPSLLNRVSSFLVLMSAHTFSLSYEPLRNMKVNPVNLAFLLILCTRVADNSEICLVRNFHSITCPREMHVNASELWLLSAKCYRIAVSGNDLALYRLFATIKIRRNNHAHSGR